MHRSLVRLLLTSTITLPLLSLGGCTGGSEPEAGQFAGQTIPPHLTAVEQRDEMVLPLDGPGATLSQTQRLALDRFISTLAAGRPETLHLDIDGPQTGVQAARAVAVEAGVDPVKVSWVPPPANADGKSAAARIHVVGSIWQADYPKCPRESHYVIGGADNTGASDYGCATRSDLEAMVADPRDLVQGEGGGQTDGVQTSAAIDRLHQGKVKPIDTTGIKASGGGS